jgi:hypothetical protein
MRIKMTSVIIVALSIIMTSLAVPLSASPVLVDDFNDNYRNRTLWSDNYHGADTIVQETNGQVEIALPSYATNWVPSGNFGGGYIANFKVAGDFDMQVDFHLINWPYANGVRVFFNIWIYGGPGFNVQRTSFGSNQIPGQPRDWYCADFGSGGLGAATSDLSGTLRWVRSGTLYTGYYATNNGWASLGSTTAIAGNVTPHISAASSDASFCHQDVKIAFDNFTVNSGQIVPEPSSCLAVFGGLLALGGMIWKRIH